jgi:hypothetical protein
MAKKHKDEMVKAEYLASLSQAEVYTGDPAPPVTAESVFGHSPPSPPTITDDSMDIDNILSTQTESPPPPVTHSDEHFPDHHHLVPDDDFQPENNLDDLPCGLESYNESFETMAIEDELRAFSEIRYGSSLNIL